MWGVTTVGGMVLIVSVMASLARGASGVTMESITSGEQGRYTTAPTGQTDTQGQTATTGQRGQSSTADMERARTVGAGAFWAAFAAMLLSLVSSVLGAIAGVTRRQRELSAHVAQHQPGAVPSLRTADSAI